MGKKTVRAAVRASAPVAPVAPVAPPLRGAYDCLAAAEYLSISRSELYRQMAAGAIRFVKIGRLRRVLRSELDRFLAERAAEAEEERCGGDAA